ncbi:ABC transporter permease [Melioribacteraceae bacterium 4301-Me]|uniref:ABC transporter permease n=1 Tax=Pyranulibacter aquaticus TaxID=3163344 RepID=UPI0035968648
MKTILNIIIKEFLQLKRDPKLFSIIFVAPAIQLILLGYAANLDIFNISTAVYDMDKSVTSRSFIEKFESSGYFSIKYYVDSYNRITELIDNGDVLWTLVIPNDFEKKLKRGEQVSVQALFDGSDGNKTSITLGYVTSIVSSYSSNILLQKSTMLNAKQPFGTVSPELRFWYNPNLKTRFFMLPGIVGLILTIITTTLMAMGIVKEREIGTLEQIIVSPIKPYQLIIGKTLPFVLLGFMDVLIVTAVMVYWFGISIKGDFFFLMIASLIYVLSSIGLGLFISTISKTQQQAMMVATFGVLLPMNFLSGFAFPIENMPGWIQPITYLIPLRYYITIIRGVILKGDGFTQLIPEISVLLAAGIVILIFSSLRFRKRLS